MGAPIGIERRDPASGLIRLGTVLARAGRQAESGELRVCDQGRVHLIRLLRGIISEVIWDGAVTVEPGTRFSGCQAARLFDLPRPLVTFDKAIEPRGRLLALQSGQVVLSGVLRRQDLFDPKPLVERIPVNALKLSDTGMARLGNLRISPVEKQFITALVVPTPTAMALWKRGLPPRHAAAMVVAPNLLGCFEAWRPGELPRLNPFTALERQIRTATSDYDILGILPGADPQEVDRAFRKLSFICHPDRLQNAPETERASADKVFCGITGAHSRLKSRRSRPVRHREPATEADPVARHPAPKWLELLRQSQAAARLGDRRKAQALALKALAAAPPPPVITALKALLKQVA